MTSKKEPMTDKATLIKYLLLQAWRERWTDIQWSSALKKIIPSGVNAEQYHLAEIILEQALVGMMPNNLMLVYLKNAISSQVLTVNSALKAIMSYDDIKKPMCINSLMELIKGFVDRASSYGNFEDPMQLSKSLLYLIKWSLSCCHKALQKMAENKNATEYTSIIDRTCELLQVLIEKRPSRAMLHLALLDESELFREIEQTEANVRGTLGQIQNVHITSAFREKVDFSLKLLNRISDVQVDSKSVIGMSKKTGNPTIGVLIPQEAVLNPTGDIQPLVEQLLLIERLQGLTRPILYCDLIQVCFYGLIDSNGGNEELKWVAFTFLKLPQIISALQQYPPGTDQTNLLIDGIKLLLRYTPLLDLADSICNCDCLHFLLTELVSEKHGLITGDQMKVLKELSRTAESKKPQAQESSNTQPNPSLILRAEPTVSSILKNMTLDADYSKNQDALLGVLCHMMSGKSFELILAAAAATGKLQSFANKLIKFNEFAKQSSGENSKGSNTRALLFDISFLMLCHITQLYGPHTIAIQKDTADSFFTTWAQSCSPENGKFKSPDAFPPQDASKVEILLSQFNTGGELKTGLTKWHEICHNAPYAIQEVLYAWEYGVMTEEQVMAILDNVRSKMCCLPIVISVWISSYIAISDENARKKPIKMLQHLLSPWHPDMNTPYYNERCHLMAIILKSMTQDIIPSSSKPQPEFLGKTQLALDLLSLTFKGIFKNGCISLNVVHTLEYLLGICGTRWFCDSIIKEMVSLSYPDELEKSVCIVFGIFHISLEQLTLCLIHQTLPTLLQSSNYKSYLLIDPKGHSLAKLCVMCISALHTHKQYYKDSHSSCQLVRKRYRTIDFQSNESLNGSVISKKDEDTEDVKPPKVRKVQEEVLTLDCEGFNFDVNTSKEETESTPQYDTKDPLNKGLIKLFSLFLSVLSEGSANPKASFIVSFIKEAVKCSGDNARFILQFMPANMVTQMLKGVPGCFSTDLLLSTCDLRSNRGRSIAAKAICQNARMATRQESPLSKASQIRV